jgi:hypothetical protein
MVPVVPKIVYFLRLIMINTENRKSQLFQGFAGFPTRRRKRLRLTTEQKVGGSELPRRAIEKKLPCFICGSFFCNFSDNLWSNKIGSKRALSKDSAILYLSFFMPGFNGDINKEFSVNYYLQNMVIVLN